jgi:hypothetical protein
MRIGCRRRTRSADCRFIVDYNGTPCLADSTSDKYSFLQVLDTHAADLKRISFMLGSFQVAEVVMQRTIKYRGFEIDIQLIASAPDMFDVTFQIKGRDNLGILGAHGHRIPLRNGPFTRRWAYLVAEIAGQAAIDVLLGPAD